MQLPGFEAQPHLAGDVLLRAGHERVERLPQRREPQTVVDELRVARLEPRLLAHEITLERDRLEVGVREEQRERARALVVLAALDADAPVLDHVDTAPAVRTDPRGRREDELVERHRLTVERDRNPLLEAHDQLPRVERERRSGCW